MGIKERIQEHLTSLLDATQEFVVSLTVSSSNDIVVVLDSLQGISIERCIHINKALQTVLDRDQEDYSLEVGSASLSDPLIHPLQYKKHKDSPVTVLFVDGTKKEGVLGESDAFGFVLHYQEVVPSPDGRHKKKQYKACEERITYNLVKRVVYRFEK